MESFCLEKESACLRGPHPCKRKKVLQMNTYSKIARHSLQVQPAKDVAALMGINRLIHIHGFLHDDTDFSQAIAGIQDGRMHISRELKP